MNIRGAENFFIPTPSPHPEQRQTLRTGVLPYPLLHYYTSGHEYSNHSLDNLEECERSSRRRTIYSKTRHSFCLHFPFATTAVQLVSITWLLCLKHTPYKLCKSLPWNIHVSQLLKFVKLCRGFLCSDFNIYFIRNTNILPHLPPSSFNCVIPPYFLLS